VGTYDAQIARTAAKIEEKGEAVNIDLLWPDAAPAMAWKPNDTVWATIETFAVFLDYTAQQYADKLVERGDVRALIPGNAYTITLQQPPLTPSQALVRAYNGTLYEIEYSIINVEILRPNGEIIMYDAQLRR